jgi:hypothetical protein
MNNLSRKKLHLYEVTNLNLCLFRKRGGTGEMQPPEIRILSDQIGSRDFKLTGDGGLAEATGRGGIL